MDAEIRTSAEYQEDDILPRRREIHAGSEARACPEMPKVVQQKPVKQKSPAEWAYERVIVYIQNFEEQLDNAHEVAMGFTGGDAGVLRIEGIGFFDPDIITFYGSDGKGMKNQLIQHVSQLNVILRALPKKVEQEAPQRIGFRLTEALESDNQKDRDEHAKTAARDR